MTVNASSPLATDPGTDLNITCTVTSASNTTEIVWDGPTNGSVISHFDMDTNTSISTLMLTDVSYGDGGTYTCSVMSLNDSVLVVITPTVTPSKLRSLVGESSVSFTCIVQASLSSSIHWFKVNQTFGKEELVINETGVAVTGSTLDFGAVTSEDAGVYRCVVDTGLEVIKSQTAELTGI